MNQKVTRSPYKVDVTYKRLQSPSLVKDLDHNLDHFPLDCAVFFVHSKQSECRALPGEARPFQAISWFSWSTAMLTSWWSSCPRTTLLVLVQRHQRSFILFPSGPPILALLLIFISLGCIRDWQPKWWITALICNVQTWDETAELALKGLLSRKWIYPGENKKEKLTK